MLSRRRRACRLGACYSHGVATRFQGRSERLPSRRLAEEPLERGRDRAVVNRPSASGTNAVRGCYCRIRDVEEVPDLPKR